MDMLRGWQETVKQIPDLVVTMKKSEETKACMN
jgi:hypothetical protein